MSTAAEASSDGARFWKLERRQGETLRACLERTLREAIREGSLRAGVELPASRVLAAELGVSRGVATDAYAELEAQGYLLVEPRRPPVVAEINTGSPKPAATPPARPPRPRFDMTPTAPDVTLFPRSLWATALAAAVREAPADALDYGHPQGTETLRERLADELGRTRGVISDPSRIVIVQGTAQGLDLVLRVLGRRGAGRVAVEDPSLARQQQQIEGLGLSLIGQPVDRDGLIVSGLEADAVVVSPAHQFPTGAVLSGARRRELLDWSRGSGGLVIEDDYDAEFRYDREPVRALQGIQPDNVIYLGTTSKTFAPALRLGWLVAPSHLIEELVAVKELLDDFSPTLEQLALARMLEAGHYQRHIRKTRGVYRERRNTLIRALQAHFPYLSVSGVAAGLSVTLNLPADCDDTEIERGAAAAGIRVETLSRYALGARRHPGLVIGYGRVHEAAIGPAIDALSDILTPALLKSHGGNDGLSGLP